MLNDYFQFTISEHLVSAIINGDNSGLNDVEEKELDNFLAQYSAYKNATWGIDSVNPHFIDCDVTGLFSNCYDVKMHFTNDSL
jgi:hypothetical protein